MAYADYNAPPLIHMRAKLAQDGLAQPTEPPDGSEVLAFPVSCYLLLLLLLLLTNPS